MARVALVPESSVVVIIDLQPKFLVAMHQAPRVLARSTFLASVASLIGVPVLATEQNVARMGTLDPGIAAHVSKPAFDKMTFSAYSSSGFLEALEETGRNQVIIVGIETHICVSLTALDLITRGYEVVVCPDAVSARTEDRHKLGMERIRDGGIVPAHTEAIAYEWLQSAANPQFREALQLVKDAEF